MATHNFFLVNPHLSSEDRFTAFWACLLRNDPRLGQAIVDRLTQLAGVASSRLIDVVDHPGGSLGNRPDCLLRLEGSDILCEHKLEAPLGKDQLERYLDLARGSRKYLTVIGNRSLQISEAVRRSRYFLKPQSGQRPHFLWSDLYPAVSRSRSVLSRQFREYMDALGMNPWTWGRLGDPFSDDAAREAFLRLYDPLVAQLRANGITVVRQSNSLGLQIKRPGGRVHLLYAAPDKSDRGWGLPLSGRLFRMTVWIQGKRRILGKADEFVGGRGPKIFSYWLSRSAAPWKPDVFCERNYYLPLDEILVRGEARSAGNISNVVWRVIRHLGKELGF